MFGVVDRIPIKSRASVPEFPKFNFTLFLARRDPNPAP